MANVQVPLTEETHRALRVVALAERRKLGQQAAVILERALKRRALRPQGEPPADLDVAGAAR